MASHLTAYSLDRKIKPWGVLIESYPGSGDGHRAARRDRDRAV